MRAAGSNKAEQTRREILDAALRQFAERGYAGTSIDNIVKAARVTKPALYYHFGSKAGLFEAVAERTEDELLKLIRQVEANATTVCDALVEICAALFRWGHLRPEVLGLAAQITRAAGGSLPPEAHCPEKARHLLEVIQKIMERGLAKGVFRGEFNGRQLAFGFLGTMHFHIVLCPQDTGRRLTWHMAQQAVSLFLKGAAVDAAGLGRQPRRPRNGSVR